jgi:hypothetical protein
LAKLFSISTVDEKTRAAQKEKNPKKKKKKKKKKRTLPCELFAYFFAVNDHPAELRFVDCHTISVFRA